MSTSVADLVATLRADTSGFDGPVQGSIATAQALGSTLSGGVNGALSAFGNLMETVGGIAGGVLVAGFTAAIASGISFSSMIDNAAVSFQGFGESSSQAAANISAVTNMANQLGQSQPGMLKASETLQALTGGAENNAKTLTALAGAAATTQMPIQQLTSQLGYLYQAFGQGDTSIGFMGRVLVREGLIPQSTLDQVTAMAKAGVDINSIWSVVMNTMAGGSQAAAQYATTLSGLTTSVKGLVASDSGTAFQPLYDGIKKVMEALKELLSSPAVLSFARDISGDLDKLMPKFDDLANGISNLGKNSGAITGLVTDFKDLIPVLGTLAGMAVGSGVGILGDLPLIGTALGPLTALLGPATLGLAGFLATSNETRDAVGHLVSALGNLLSSLAPLGAAAAGLLGSLQPIAADVINVTASIINFVASSRQLLDSLLLLAAAYAAFSVWEKASALLAGVGAAMTGLIIDTEEVAAAEQLQAEAGAELASALGAVAIAEENLTGVQAANSAAMVSTMDYWGTMRANGIALAAAEDELAVATEGLNVAMDRAAAADAAAGEAATASAAGFASLLGPIGMVVGAFAALNAVIPKSWLGGKDLFDTAIVGFKTMGEGIASVIPGLDHLVSKMEEANNIKSTTGSFMDNFKSTAPQVDTSDIQSIQAAADNASTALNNLTVEKNNMNSGQVDIVPGGQKINQGEIDALTPAWQKATDAATNANNTIQAVMAKTGQSFADVAAQAQKLGIDLTESLGSTQGKANLQELVGSAQAIAPVVDQASTALKHLSAELTSFLAVASGKQGNDYFTVTKAQVDALAAAIANLKAQGQDTSTAEGDLAAMAALEGKTQETKAYAEAQLKAFESQQKQVQLSQQLTQAEQGEVSAQEGVVRANQAAQNASHSLTQAIQSQENAMVSLSNAITSQAKAVVTLQQADDEISASTQFMNEALAGNQDKYWDLVKTLDQLTPDQKALGQEILSEANWVTSLQNQYDQLNNTYTQMGEQLTTLTDKMKMYQDVLAHPLAGQGAMDQAVETNKEAQASLQGQIDVLELQGIPTQDQRIVQLKNQLDILKAQNDLLQQQDTLTLGAEKFKLQQAQNTIEVNFQQAIDAATAVGKLKDQINILQTQEDNLKPSVDAAKAALDQASRTVDIQVQALQAMASADQAAQNAQDQVQASSWAVTNAQWSLEGANWAVTNAQWSLEASGWAVQNANWALQNSIYSVQQAHAGMAQEVLQNNSNMANSSYNTISAMIQDLAALQQTAFNVASNLQQAGANVANAANNELQLLAQAGASPAFLFLAGGGYIDTPTPAVVGEAGPEIILPLSDTDRSLQLISQYAPHLLGGGASAGPSMASAGGGGGGGVNIASGAIQVEVNVPGGMSIPPELADAIASTINVTLSDVFNTYQANR